MSYERDWFYNEKNAKNIRRGVSLRRRKKNIQATMVEILENHDIFSARSEMDRREIAAKIDCFVMEYEKMAAALAEPAQVYGLPAAVENYFEMLWEKGKDVRLRTLKEVAFGLDIFSDLCLAVQAEQGKNVEVLYLLSDYDQMDISAWALEEEIRRKLSSMHLSSRGMERMMKALAKGKSPVATAAALGRESHDLKCIAALELYIKDCVEIQPEEAAYIACATVEMQAIADAVHWGMIGEDVANVLILLTFLALILVLAYYFPPFLELHHTIGEMGITSATNVLGNILEANAAQLRNKMLLGSAGLLFGIRLLGNLPDWVTNLPEQTKGLLRPDVEPVVEGFRRMIAYRKKEELLEEHQKTPEERQREEQELYGSLSQERKDRLSLN